jgi:hypothetical protein
MSRPQDLPALPPDVLALLDAERDAPPMPDAARERVAAKLEATLMAGSLAAAAAHAEAGRSAVWVGLLGKKLAIGVAAVSLGVSGYALHEHRTRRDVGASLRAAERPTVVRGAENASPAGGGARPETPPPVPIAPPPIAASAQTASPTLAASSPAVAPAPSAPPSAPPSGSGALADRGLAAERARLEEARAALRRGEPNAAITALASHAREFPAGRLAEERESAWVVALARAGRRDEAVRRADAFRARWPSSIYGASVDAALGNAP